MADTEECGLTVAASCRSMSAAVLRAICAGVFFSASAFDRIGLE